MNPLDVMQYGQRDIDQLLGRLRDDDWSAIALGVWTTKDVVGHLGAFELRFADVLATFLDEPPDSDLIRSNPATFNDDQAAVRKAWSVDQVLDEFRLAHSRVLDRAGRISADTWSRIGTIPWYGPEYALDDLVVYSMYGHKREHAPQLEAVLERPGR